MVSIPAPAPLDPRAEREAQARRDRRERIACAMMPSAAATRLSDADKRYYEDLARKDPARATSEMGRHSARIALALADALISLIDEDADPLKHARPYGEAIRG